MIKSITNTKLKKNLADCRDVSALTVLITCIQTEDLAGFGRP